MSRVLWLLFSVVLHTLALPPLEVPLVAWFALIPFFHALRDVGTGRGALLGLLWGSAAAWGFGYWVPAALTSYYEQSLWFGYSFSLAASVVFCGSYYAGFAACYCWGAKRSSGTGRLLLVPALWVTWELARAKFLSGCPWLLYGYAMLPHSTLAQVADFGGVYLLSFVLVLANASILEAFIRRRTLLLLPSVAAVVLIYVYGAYRLAEPLPNSPRVPILIVQGNNDLGAQWRAELYAAGLEKYLRLSVTAARQQPTDLIIWPESAVTFFLAREPLYQKAIARVLQSVGADLVVGAPHYEDPKSPRPRYMNSAFYLTEAGQIRDRYDKVHLLPFAEYFPLRTIELLRRSFERVRFFTPGAEAKLLDTRFGKIATFICFEGIFPDLVRRGMAGGAGFVVNLSNDAWFGSAAGREQHLDMVRLRAIENRSWVIRATTTGISAVIDPFGRIVSQTESSVESTLAAEIVPMQIATPYESVGDLFAYVCLLGSLVAGAKLAAKQRVEGEAAAPHRRHRTAAVLGSRANRGPRDRVGSIRPR